MRLPLIVFFTLAFQIGSAQPVFFEITYGNGGGDFSRSLKQLPDGSIFVLGYSDSGAWGRNDVALTRLTKQGVVVWTKYYGDTLDQYGNYFDITYDGKFIVTGETSTPANGLDFFIYKIDTAGNLMWAQTYGTLVNESMRHIEETSDKGFIITGFQSDTNSFNDTYIVKTDSIGNIEWERWQGGVDNDYGFLAHQLPDNGYVISSDTKSFGNGGYDVNLTRIGTSGNTLWNYYYGDAFQNGCQGLFITAAGKFLSYGETEIFTFSPFEFFIELIDTSGTSLWRRTFGGINTDAAFSIVENPDQTFVLTGYSNSVMPGPLNLAVVKVDTNGNMIWNRSYGGNGIDIGYEIIHSQDNGYLICGHRSDSTNIQVYLLHVDQTGLLTGLNEQIVSNDDLVAYPNPFSDKCTIDLKNVPDPGKARLLILDETGRDVSWIFRYSISSEGLIINAQGAVSGLYFGQILTEKQIYRFKLVMAGL